MPSSQKNRKKFPETQSGILDLSTESDRGCVLASHAWIEKLLGDNIRNRLTQTGGPGAANVIVELIGDDAKNNGGPISMFAHRARLAFALGLIQHGTYQSLVELNDLRTHFAHHPGKVALTLQRVNAIRGPLAADVKHPVRQSTVLIEGNIAGRPHAVQEFLTFIAWLRLILGDPTQACLGPESTAQLRKKSAKAGVTL